MLYLFKVRKLGPFLAHGRQYRRVGLIYFLMSSQCFIHMQDKVDIYSFLFQFFMFQFKWWSVVGTQHPVNPVCVLPHSHIPMVVGHNVQSFVYRLLEFHSCSQQFRRTQQVFLRPFIAETLISPLFFSGGMVILLLCHKGIMPVPQLQPV